MELENGSTIDTIDSKDTIRSRRAKLWELLNAQYERELTEEEEKVIESFTTAKSVDTENFKKEYDCIWVSSSEERRIMDRKNQRRIEAKKCPFCGDAWIEVYESSYGGFFVECQNCGANIGNPDSEEWAIREWNIRDGELNDHI